MNLSPAQLAAEYQPLDRDAHIAAALRGEVQRRVVNGPDFPMHSVDPTHRASDGSDRMLDAIERITDRRACGCWIGSSQCAVCGDAFIRLSSFVIRNPAWLSNLY